MPLRLSTVCLGLLLLVSGCTGLSRTSPAWLEAPSALSLEQAREDVEAAMGREVVWGGRIVRSVNTEEGALLEVLEQPLDPRGRPKASDSSEGRFLVLFPGYLETLIYAPGREVTVSGPIEASRTRALQEIEYTYPLIRTEAIQLWEEEPEAVRVEQVNTPRGVPPYPWDPWPWRRPLYW